MNVPGDKSLPLVEATCLCSYVGKSRYPETYRCSACYYEARSKSTLAKAQKLRERADELETEAGVFDERRKAFIARHPEAGVRVSG